MSELHFFDPKAEFSIVERRLPHWTQPGVVTFITWRTHDSLPADVVERWRHERFQWLREHGINPRSADWRTQLENLGRAASIEFYRHFSDRWHDELDAGHGACVLRDPALAKIVADSLHKFDGDRYDLTDYVVMPNHVHLLAAFRDEQGVLDQCDSWKHYTAGKINRELKTQGRFWQQDGFDHLIRPPEHFEYYRGYIADNPRMARLAPGCYLAWSKPL